MKSILMRLIITQVFASELYVRFIKASDELCDNAPILLTILQQEVLIFFSLL